MIKRTKYNHKVITYTTNPKIYFYCDIQINDYQIFYYGKELSIFYKILVFPKKPGELLLNALLTIT